MPLDHKKISELTAATSLSAANIIPVVQSGETKRATLTQLRGGMGLDETATVRFNRIGVNHASPQEALDVNGNIRCTRRLTFEPLAEIFHRGDNSAGRFVDFDFPNISTQSATVRIFRATNTTGVRRLLLQRGDGSGNIDIQLGVGGIGSYFNSGNVGIGTSTPTEKLDVFGNVRATGFINTSDYRLKKDAHPISQAAARLLNLRPYQFTWSENAPHDLRGKTVEGFFAHEVQTVIPEAVIGDKDAMQAITHPARGNVIDADGKIIEENIPQADALIPEYARWVETIPAKTEEQPIWQGLDQSRIIPLLTAALQDALKRIELLEKS